MKKLYKVVNGKELLKYKLSHKELVDRVQCLQSRIYSWGDFMDYNMKIEILMILKGDVKNEEFRKSNTTRKI